MKVADTELAKYFYISYSTLMDWKRGKHKKRYERLRNTYMRVKHLDQIEEAKQALAELDSDEYIHAKETE